MPSVTWFQMASNSRSTSDGGSSKSCDFSSASSSSRLSFMREAASYSFLICAETSVFSFSRSSAPSDLANSSLISGVTGFSTSFTVTSKTASLPASSATGYSAGKVPLTSRRSPFTAPLRPSSKPGMKLALPMTRLKPSPEPRSNGCAIDRADEVDRHAVAVAGLAALLGGERLIALGETGDGLVERVGVDIGHETLELESLEIGELHLGQHVEAHHVGEVGLTRHHALDLGGVLGEFDRRHHGGALLAVGDGLGARLADRLLQDIAHDGAAEHLLDVGERHLALAEALELDLVLDLVEVVREALAELIGCDHHLELALQAFRTRFRDLHEICFLRSLRSL